MPALWCCQHCGAARCLQDKALRQLVFRHITADIKNSNKRHRNERLNRAVQNFMYRCGQVWRWWVQPEGELLGEGGQGKMCSRKARLLYGQVAGEVVPVVIGMWVGAACALCQGRAAVSFCCVSSFLFHLCCIHLVNSVLQDEHEATAKKGLAVLTEMWQRHVWRDARTG